MAILKFYVHTNFNIACGHGGNDTAQRLHSAQHAIEITNIIELKIECL